MRLGKREIIYLPLHCHHQNDSCIRMGSDEMYMRMVGGCYIEIGIVRNAECRDEEAL